MLSPLVDGGLEPLPHLRFKVNVTNVTSELMRNEMSNGKWHHAVQYFFFIAH